MVAIVFGGEIWIQYIYSKDVSEIEPICVQLHHKKQILFLRSELTQL